MTLQNLQFYLHICIGQETSQILFFFIIIISASEISAAICHSWYLTDNHQFQHPYLLMSTVDPNFAIFLDPYRSLQFNFDIYL